MILTIPDILSPAEVAVITQTVPDLEFQDGRNTAGIHARKVKANDQATASPARDAILDKVGAALRAHPVFASAARPRAMTPLILSRYRQGQTYGTHVDDALMGGLRTDISFTLFLSDPATYTGGELVITDTLEERAIKLPAGSVVVYPSTTLHRVDPVTEGTRLAIVGWVQSQIRDAGRREVLFDLDRCIATGGEEASMALLRKTRSNLLRMWADD